MNATEKAAFYERCRTLPRSTRMAEISKATRTMLRLEGRLASRVRTSAGGHCRIDAAEGITREQISAVLRERFPLLTDRSEIESDYFDFIFLI